MSCHRSVIKLISGEYEQPKFLAVEKQPARYVRENTKHAKCLHNFLRRVNGSDKKKTKLADNAYKHACDVTTLRGT